MAKIINITDKLSSEKPKIVIGDKEYTVNDGMETVLKFEELASDSSADNMVQAIELSLGADAVKELQVRKMSISNFKVLTIAIMAAVQGIEYDEAAKRFQG
ncbi:hypothetical protein [Petroclostridium sp. X23]|uniref:hypothetical protein n=1 Tax=Petroclostridium sp. X23 TaxID=3045146 RepID=UPI0024AD3FAC|nr:hypothetical protein [Petroclostridium sp. X23]WHH58486.1 hypothetical protein QKW49_22235 [Petroclostridium sp. X23]